VAKITTCIFDAYGTLFDVNAAARAVAASGAHEGFATIWPAVSAHWRSKQLEYTWLRSLMGAHVDFWQITQDGLDWALEVNACEGPELREALLSVYWTLPSFPEVPVMLESLKQAGFQTGILSNGSLDMLAGAVTSAGVGAQLDAVLSVDEVGIFKPRAEVYDLVGQHFGCARDEVLFVSSNGWDAAGAAHYGFRTLWVNRMGQPQDRLGVSADAEVQTLVDVPQIAQTGL